MLATNYKEFSDRTIDILMEVMNNTEIGKKIVKEVKEKALTENPDMTPDEWNGIKRNLLLSAWVAMMEKFPELKHEMAIHLYNEFNRK